LEFRETIKKLVKIMKKKSSCRSIIKGLLSLSLFCHFGLCAQNNSEFLIQQKVEVLGNLAREPMFVEHPSGSLFVTGYNNGTKSPQLWRSDDKGSSWKKLDVGNQSEGADGNSDVDLAVDSDGTLYFVTMRYTKFPENIEDFDVSEAKGKHIAIGTSSDKGANWSWTYLSKSDYDDRPWVKIASDNSVHVIWNNDKGVHHMVSDDKGKNWHERPLIYPKGGSSHFASGKDGLLAVRVSALSASGLIFDSQTDLIRISKDLGKSWKSIMLPGHRTWKSDISKGVDRWVDPIAWDADNRLYHLWTEGNEMTIAVSDDYGEHWQMFTVGKGDQPLYFPFLYVANGNIVCSWLSGYGNDLRHVVASMTIKKEQLTIKKMNEFELSNIKGRFGTESELSNGGEYFPIGMLNDGTIGMVTTIQDYENNQLGFTWWRLR